MAFYKGEDPKKEWVEKLELAYQLEKEGTPTFLYEILTELKLRGYSKLMSSDILLNKLTGLQFEGHVPEIQSISLYLAEFFYNKHKNSTSKVHLKNACEIYDEYNISAKFFNGSLRCYIYLSDINSSIESKMRSSGLLHDNVNASEIKENLTNRELEILQLIGQGKSNKEIAETLFISIGTTKWHINHIYSKLSVKKRFNAIEKAKRLNLIY
ncbi:MAG: response regulator transcription factor [Firmicutes bacterium]|nr:response regulator transcription factor [Bacillota bacterium]